jgi:hypothetical protein
MASIIEETQDTLRQIETELEEANSNIEKLQKIIKNQKQKTIKSLKNQNNISEQLYKTSLIAQRLYWNKNRIEDKKKRNEAKTKRNEAKTKRNKAKKEYENQEIRNAIIKSFPGKMNTLSKKRNALSKKRNQYLLESETKQKQINSIDEQLSKNNNSSTINPLDMTNKEYITKLEQLLTKASSFIKQKN